VSEQEKRPDRFWLVFGLIAAGCVLIVAPILLCAGLLLPAIQKARAAAQRQQIQLEEQQEAVPVEAAADAAAARAEPAVEPQPAPVTPSAKPE